MTAVRKKINQSTILSSLGVSSLHAEIRKSKCGAVLLIMGVIGIKDFCNDNILLMTHSGKVKISGEGLSVSVFENHTVEIYGKIEGVVFTYGKG